MKPIYPLIPKSNKDLLPGQFWGIKLTNNKYACGRILATATKSYGPGWSKTLLVGLLDWIDNKPPTEETIAGRKVLSQGSAHIKTIEHTGGSILGYRPLELDGIEPALEVSQSGYQPNVSQLIKGFEVVRMSNPEDHEKYPVQAAWGYDVIRVRAEKLLC